MNKIYATLIFLCFFSVQTPHAQQTDITETFNSYIQATQSDQVSEQLDFFHPRLFDYLSKDTFLLALEMIKRDTMIHVGNEKLLSVSDIFSENDVQYSLLTFSQQMTMDMSAIKDQGGGDFVLSLMMKEFKSEYGEQNVMFDEKSSKLEITLTNRYYVIRDPKLGGWKFLPKEEKSAYITEQIIPESIRQKI